MCNILITLPSSIHKPVMLSLISRIYGRNSKGTLTKYQESMNNVAMELCMQNPNVIERHSWNCQGRS